MASNSRSNRECTILVCACGRAPGCVTCHDLLLISLHFEKRKYVRESVRWLCTFLFAQKSTEKTFLYNCFNCRGFACSSKTLHLSRAFTHAFMGVRSELKSTVCYMTSARSYYAAHTAAVRREVKSTVDRNFSIFMRVARSQTKRTISNAKHAIGLKLGGRLVLG